MESRTWYCPACADDRDFVQPPCVDGHTADGGECPEWACADCGAAVFAGTTTITRAPASAASAPVRRAA